MGFNSGFKGLTGTPCAYVPYYLTLFVHSIRSDLIHTWGGGRLDVSEYQIRRTNSFEATKITHFTTTFYARNNTAFVILVLQNSVLFPTVTQSKNYPIFMELLRSLPSLQQLHTSLYAAT